MNDFIAERKMRLDFLRSPNLLYKQFFERQLLNNTMVDKKAAKKAMQLASSINYKHPKLSSETYLAHPYRVASMALNEIKSDCTHAVITAFLHNVLEVSNIHYEFLVFHVGSLITQGLLTLKVDRQQQQDSTYKKNYYLAIAKAPIFVGQIKVLDKLDNLFVLGLNPHDHVRQQYCDEIEKHLLPLTQIVFPTLVSYVTELLHETKITGHYEL